MTYKKHIIFGGAVMYSADGKPYTVSDWSDGTGDIYVHDPNGIYMNISKAPELFWDYPFISLRS